MQNTQTQIDEAQDASFHQLDLREYQLVIEEVKRKIEEDKETSCKERQLTEWSDEWLDYARDALFDKAEILACKDIDIKSQIGRHLAESPWVDANDNINGE